MSPFSTTVLRTAFGLAVIAVSGAVTAVTPAKAQPPTDRASTIALRSATIDVHDEASTIPDHLRATAAAPGSERFVWIKFPGPVSAAERQALEGMVERVYTYLPHDSFLVELAPDTRPEELLAKTGASWSGPFHPAYKIAPELAAIEPGVPLKDGGANGGDGERHIVLVHVFPGADLDALIARLTERGVEVVGRSSGGRFSRLRLLASAAEVAAWREPLAQMAEVFFVDLEARRVLLNDTTVTVAQSGTPSGGPTPVYDAGIYGEGQIVGIVDTGIDADMCYFRDPARGLPPQNLCNGGTTVDLAQRKVIAVDFLWSNECSGGIASNEWDTQDHGSHVAGTVAGDNFANPLLHDAGDGLAPGAKLVIQDCGFSTDNCADCPGIGCPVVDLNPIFQQAYDQGARIHTNSWGDDENNPTGGLYSAGSEDADEFMWNHKDLLLIFAAGNSGTASQTVLSPSTAKNVVAVGATNRGSSAESIASFSSCGPTADGRIKPDVTMPGVSIVSANADTNISSNNCNTRTNSGTSMAAPGVAGAAALVRQYFVDGFHPTGAAVPADGFTPSAALLKAALINSGHDMTSVAAIPSNCQGWGRVLLDDVLHFSGDARDLFVEDDTTGFAQGASGVTRTFNIDVSAGEPFEVTLTWTDFPSTPIANPQIVNDLDLEVSGPSGTFLGNVFSGGQSATGGSADRLNTVEQVLIANPVTGTYTVTVRAFNVIEGPQPFALVATGEFDTVPPPPPPPPPPTCGTLLHECDFESGPCQWVNGNDSCGTGAFVRGTPDATAWQVSNGTISYFTQPNPNGVGGDDVDGGTCEALSPELAVAAGSDVTVSIDYFHGQRDAGDDANDGFTIEVLLDGAVIDTLVGIGDVTTNPVWSTVSTTVNAAAAGNVRLRVRASDAPAGGDIVEGGIDNVQICSDTAPPPPPPPPAGCAAEVDFESGAAGWTNDGASTCSTGSFVVETPTAVSNGGVTTQPAGDHTSGTGNAFFSAVNTSAGVNDVDGGNCVVLSPVYNVAEASDVSLFYFHGQRDQGGDGTGDFFRLEISTDGGGNYAPMVSIGDVTSQAAWTEATTTVAAGAQVRFRVQVSDGTAGGDLVEAGIDDVSICPSN